MRYYFDFEFDGADGPVISLGIVSDANQSMYLVTGYEPKDPWVIENVTPFEIISYHKANRFRCCRDLQIRKFILGFTKEDRYPEFISDSPVDTWRLARYLNLDENGKYLPCPYPEITFTVKDIDIYPTDLEGMIQHNAWCDAMALKHALQF